MEKLANDFLKDLPDDRLKKCSWQFTKEFSKELLGVFINRNPNGLQKENEKEFHKKHLKALPKEYLLELSVTI